MGTGVAVRLSTRLTLGLIVLSVLVGCGSDKGERPLLFTVGALAVSTVTEEMQARKAAKAAKAEKAERAGKTEKAGKAGKTEKAGKAGKTEKPGKATREKSKVSRAALEKPGLPVLRAVIPAMGADRILSVLESRDDVVIWKTKDGATFALRDGILIQTRGLGPDLMSSNVPTVGQLLQNGGTHQREYFFLGADDQTTRRTYTCTVTVVGREEIEIFKKTHAVTHATEVCTREQSGKVTNEFWIEGSTVRKSRQWSSAMTGYIEFEKVVD
jgi:Group 4 capsule polysaccharide lipoprotein gfcB, YjbF